VDDVEVTVIGAGMAGSECAWQLAERGVRVRLIEQKPGKRTPAAELPTYAEMVCSNSLRGTALTHAVGLLKEELRRAGSLLLACADETRVPAGGSLAVDRVAFSERVTMRLRGHGRIVIEEREATSLPPGASPERPCVVATGPLTGDALATELARLVGTEHLAYYDAISPIVSADSVDWARVFRASRWDEGGDDAYVNCPLTREQYEAFVDAVLAAEKVAPREFEDVRYFEGCLPIEVMAERGRDTLRFGPMKPVGLTDPRTGRRPYACVQLRAEDAAQTAFNLVGFQSRMTWSAQKRVFSLIPGLESAEFLRYGSVHRNTFVDAPRVLAPDLSLRAAPGVFLCGQITGVEGYVESGASGLVLGILLAGRLRGRGDLLPPPTTALGALLGHLQRADRRDFQPSNVVWSMFPPLTPDDVTGATADRTHRRRSEPGKRARYEALARRALSDLEPYLDASGARLVRAELMGGAARLDPPSANEGAGALEAELGLA
jgi:methylenetetrahydrofolate--tRNA-(uracil-5-)-methyltransferase